MASPQQEAQARAAGFPSYEAMVLFYRRRSESLKDSHTVAAPGTQPAGQMPQTMNQAEHQAFSWTPASIFSYLADKYDQATGQGRYAK